MLVLRFHLWTHQQLLKNITNDGDMRGDGVARSTLPEQVVFVIF